jgi:hypothetical protein
MRVLAALACAAALPAHADPVRDLVVASQTDNVTLVRKLLKSGLSASTIDPVSGEPVLIVALREGSQRVAELLVDDPTLQLEQAAPNGNTALMMAAYKNQRSIAERLLARGAAVNRPGWSPLHYAAAGGSDDIARLLIGRGASVNAPATAGLTPLMMAVREGHESTAALLLAAGANPALKDASGASAADMALALDRPRLAALLKKHGTAR